MPFGVQVQVLSRAPVRFMPLSGAFLDGDFIKNAPIRGQRGTRLANGLSRHVP